MPPKLSILIITHDQLDLLKRCLASVLSQRLSCTYEIIISDDRSTDGTWEYVDRIQKENRIIRGVRCNSDECDPVMVSERCAWNKLNAYEHARGSYFVNIDADDYLSGDDIYQKQIDLLDSHPECSMCMQRVVSLKEGDNINNGTIWPRHAALIDGELIPDEYLLDGSARSVNPAFMIRRHPEDDMRLLYGKWFDDTIITYHHIQYGPVVFLDRADYIYVQYDKSINHSMNADDRDITYGLLPVHHSLLIPVLSNDFIKHNLPVLNHTIKCSSDIPDLSPDYRDYLSQFKAFVYKYYTEKRHGIMSRCRIKLARFLLAAGTRFHFSGRPFLHLVKTTLI